MINNVSSFLKPYERVVIGTSAVAIGFLVRPLVVKVANIALNVLRSFVDWFNERTLIVHIRSLGCEECSDIHRGHMRG